MSQKPPAKQPKHRWLSWMGLEAPPADPEAWVPVATGRVDDPDTGASNFASAVAKALTEDGLEAHQRPYVVPDNHGLAAAANLTNPSAVDRVRVAVLVHTRDVARARSIVGTAEDPELSGKSVSEAKAAFWLSQDDHPGT